MRDTRHRSYAIIGTGAVGGFYGGLLTRAGFDVHFLARSDYDILSREGLRVDSPLGDFNVPVNVHDSAEKVPRCDVVCVCIKATGNGALDELLPDLVHPGCCVLLIQNGLGVEPAIASLVGPEVSVLGGLAFLCSNRIAPGHIRHLDYGKLLVAEYGDGYRAQGVTSAARGVAADMESAGIETEAGGDLLLARWKKLVWNIPFNGLSVVLDASTDAIMGDPDTRELAHQLTLEVQSGAGACGARIDDGFVEFIMSFTEHMASYATSMKLDADAGRPMEVEALFGEPLRMAHAKGVQLPKIEMLYQLLSAIDRKAVAVPS